MGKYLDNNGLSYFWGKIKAAFAAIGHNHTGVYIPVSASCNKAWNWSGQAGQPSWLWGSNDGSNMYVYDPSNFNVAQLGGHPYDYFLATGNANVRTGQCTLSTAGETWVGFSSPMGGTPIVILCLATTTGGAVPAPKVRGVANTGFNAIIGGSGYSGIVCNYIAIW